MCLHCLRALPRRVHVCSVPACLLGCCVAVCATRHSSLTFAPPPSLPPRHARLPVRQVITFGNAQPGVRAVLLSDAAADRLSYYSPVLGVHHYRYCDKRDAWVGETDDHFLVEMLSRDLVQHCQGLPAF